jgi:two-component system sensor histidine kinase KdpD
VTALIGARTSAGPAGTAGESRLSMESIIELLHVIDEETDRLNRFIEGLSTAGVADNAGPVNFPPVGILNIVRAGLARADALTRDHRVVTAIDEELPLVSVDASAVTEVLYILLDNASKYAPPGSAIRVSAGQEDDRYVRAAVSDDGPGIAAEYRERVFENFFRIPARESRDPRRTGVGLGLPIARRLIEAQTGRMWIETPPSGRGTTIAFTLPVAVEIRSVDQPVHALTSN